MNALCLFCLLLSTAALAAQDHWPQWRGPQRNGVAATARPPLEWDAQRNVLWKTPLPSWSGSSPVVWGERLFLVSPEPGAKPPPTSAEPRQLWRNQGERDPGGDRLHLLCLSTADGSVLWRRTLDSGNKLYLKHNAASPSPVTDGRHVWVLTGNGVLSAYDMDGKRVWQRHLQQAYGAFGLMWGYASSPLLHDGRIIVQVLHGMNTDDPSYLVAFDAADGRELWRQERHTDARSESPDAYTTPTLWGQGDAAQIIVTGGDYITAHAPRSGKELWRVGGLNPEKQQNYRIVASPVVAGGMLFAPTRKKPLLALRPATSGSGAPLEVAWRWEGPAAPDVPTPVSDGRRLYLVDDKGRVICLDAASGKVVWGPERTAQGTVSASPVLAAGRLYCLNEDGVTTVLAAGPEYKLLATNPLDGAYTLSSPAFVGDRLYIRTATHLYCIGEKPKN